MILCQASIASFFRFFTPFSDLTSKSETCGTPFLSSDNRVCTPFFKNGVKNGGHTLLFLDKNGVPQLSLFDVKSENGVKNGVHTLF